MTKGRDYKAERDATRRRREQAYERLRFEVDSASARDLTRTTGSNKVAFEPEKLSWKDRLCADIKRYKSKT